MTGPRWRALAEALEADIRAGRYAPGEKLPSLEEWGDSAERHSQTTVLRVYRILVDKGLAVTIHGKGTFVAEQLPTPMPSLEERVAALEERVARLESPDS